MVTLTDIMRRLNLRGACGARPLPPLILMTDDERLADPEPVIAALPRGSAVIVRHYRAPGRAALARRLRRLCRARGVLLLIAGDARLAVAVGADGVHLPEAMVRAAPQRWRLWCPGRLVTAAAHSPAALFLAARAGADAALLSPVFPTASHPQAASLGPLRFARWCRRAPLPVFALGGVGAHTARRLAGCGAVGIAGIGGFYRRSVSAARMPQ